MAAPGFKRFLRDRIIFTLSFFNKSNFQVKDNRLLEDIRSYRDLMTLVCFCNKYRNVLGIKTGNIEDEISRFFLHKHVVMHTVDYRDESRKLIYKLELVNLDPFGNNSYRDRLDRFNIDYDKIKFDYHVGENVQNAYGNMCHTKAATSCDTICESEKVPAPFKPEEDRKKSACQELANYLDNLVNEPVVVPDETGSYDELLELKALINKAYMALHDKNLDTQWKNKDRFFSEAKVKALLSELSLPYIIKNEGTKDKRTITVTKVENC
jgi:hypothetical protein